jgi:hypothetical protein
MNPAGRITLLEKLAFVLADEETTPWRALGSGHDG